MAIKPILFNTEMVQAILDGRKSCTRRVIKPQPDEKHTYPLGFVTDSTEKKEVGCFGFGIDEYGGSIKYVKPPYQPGDILYVRETWQYLYELDGNEQIIEGTGKYYYAATDTIPFDTYVDASGVTHERVPWHPSIHMPKEAARIWLKVTDVRVERLQDITPKGAESEGVGNLFYDDIGYGEKNYGTEVDTEYGIAKEQFAWLWESTIKKSDLDRYGWDANPWVWVIEFERCEKPEGV
nr:MAG TPA: hypothetical protein [Bacteriophage sp.]